VAAGLDKYLVQLFKGLDVSAFNTSSWAITFNSLLQAVSESVSSLTTVAINTNDVELIAKLTTDAGVFSAFKNHAMQNQLVELLTNNGQPVPWNEFKKEAASVIDQYNVNWLKTEYNQAISNATMAKKWDGFVQDKELYPNLEYRAVKDSRTRASHAKFDGIILPIEHPFWDSHLPPLDWGCRCDAVSTDREVNKPADVVSALREVVNRGAVAPGFDNNPGKTGRLFSSTAGYYQNVDEKTTDIIRDNATGLVAKELAKMAANNLKDKKVSWQNVHISFAKGVSNSITADTVNSVKALITLQNADNIQTIVKNGVHSIKDNKHVFKMGKHIVYADIVDERNATFNSLIIEP
jgi:SPP1 gp7 family putative phage head morphogenesis protein